MSINTGFENEKNILEAINEKKINEIKEDHLQDFMYDMFPSITSNDLIICEEPALYVIEKNDKKFKINPKQDLIITVKGVSQYISVKEGSSNSVHQESLESFIGFLRKELRAPRNVINNILLFHWGDGTLDGTGDSKLRLKDHELKLKYPNEIEIIHNFFDNNKSQIAKRAILTGAYSENESIVDYIYHGTLEKGVWCTGNKALEMICDPENTRKPLSVGLLSFQNQNRNTTLNPRKENARKNIQFKWSSLEAIIKKNMPIKKRIKYSAKSVARGDNSHGFRNINQIIDVLNGSQINQIKHKVLKKFIISLFPQAKGSAIIMCESVNNKEKGNIKITIGRNSYKVLVKSGSNNSIHQEDFETFYNFLREEFEMPEKVITDFKKIQWADGTIDGSAPMEKWLKRKNIKKRYHKEIKNVQTHLYNEDVARAILNRFLIYGVNKDTDPLNYVYFGSSDEAYWANATDIVNFEIERLRTTRSSALLNIGSISLQAWGRTIKKSSNYDQRESIQIKAMKLKQTIKHLASQKNNQSVHKLADESEKSFVQIANQKNSDELQRKFDTKKNIYAVQVSSIQFSNIHEKKIKTKSDVYFISVNKSIDDSILIEQDFILNENDISDLQHEKIPYSGVSVKREDSKSFTYLKISNDSFVKLFDMSKDYFIACLFYTTEKDIEKNIEIIKNNASSINNLEKTFGINIKEDNIEHFKELKGRAMDEIKKVINSNKDVYEGVFFGTSIFEEPYCATYLYQKKLVHKRDLSNIDYYVSTGSGRSKGRYTLIIKPK